MVTKEQLLVNSAYSRIMKRNNREIKGVLTMEEAKAFAQRGSISAIRCRELEIFFYTDDYCLLTGIDDRFVSCTFTYPYPTIIYEQGRSTQTVLTDLEAISEKAFPSCVRLDSVDELLPFLN